MSLKLDAFDKSILNILLSNSKESTTSIGKKIRLGRENVDYKLKRLIKQGIIKEFITEFDESALKVKHHVLFAQLTRLSGDKEKEILSYLKNHKYFSWIGTAAGKWTLICDIYIPENVSLGDIMNELLVKFGNNIEEYMLLELIRGEYFFEKILGKEKKLTTSSKTKEKRNIDDLDKKIMSFLNANARISYAQLSTALNMSANGIKKRIKDLEKAEIIKKYSIILDFKKFDLEWFGIQIKMIKFDDEITKKVHNYLKNNDRVIFFYKYIGAWDYDVGFLAENSMELREFINELRTRFPDEIKITDVFITLEEIKGYHLPTGIFS